VHWKWSNADMLDLLEGVVKAYISRNKSEKDIVQNIIIFIQMVREPAEFQLQQN